MYLLLNCVWQSQLQRDGCNVTTKCSDKRSYYEDCLYFPSHLHFMLGCLMVKNIRCLGLSVNPICSYLVDGFQTENILDIELFILTSSGTGTHIRCLMFCSCLLSLLPAVLPDDAVPSQISSLRWVIFICISHFIFSPILEVKTPVCDKVWGFNSFATSWITAEWDSPVLNTLYTEHVKMEFLSLHYTCIVHWETHV